VASCNLGVCHGWLGDHAAATAQHQEALRCAISLQSFSGQSLAVSPSDPLLVSLALFAIAASLLLISAAAFLALHAEGSGAP
jgi:hypothetical protein